jgi:putative protein-disulfide isomerase
MKTKIYYVMDTMCGWCYGFSDVITKIHEKYKDVYDFTVLPGGMLVGDNVKIIDDSFANFIKSSNIKVEKLTGKRFGEEYYKNIIENTDVVLDSLPGAKAIVLIQRLKKDETFNFLKKVQESFFIEGKDANKLETYLEIAESFGISKEEFKKEFLSEDLAQETFEYFDRADSMGVESFPTVIIAEGDKVKIIAQGYSTFEELDKILSN